MNVGNDIERSRIKLVENGKDKRGGKWQENIPGEKGERGGKLGDIT